MSMNREQSLAIPTKEEWMAALTMRHGEERQKAFSAATVAVCGLGGLGSNIATALARAGIGKLILMRGYYESSPSAVQDHADRNAQDRGDGTESAGDQSLY